MPKINFSVSASAGVRTFTVTINGRGLTWTQAGAVWTGAINVPAGADNAVQYHFTGIRGSTLKITGKNGAANAVELSGAIGAGISYDIGFVSFSA